MAYGKTTRIKIEGGAELERKLKALEANAAKKIMRKAVRAGGKPIMAKTKELAPVKTGLLKRSFKIRALKTRKRSSVGIKITTGVKAPHAHLVELGTVDRRTKAGAFKGRIEPGLHFMEEAFDDQKDNAVQIVIAVTRDEILKVAK
jgi:HK97 gp10 family phage protein